MEQYYRQQAEMPHFSSYSRQRGSGFGALAAGLSTIAIPLIKKYGLPLAKKLGKRLIMEAVPEIGNVVKKRKSVKRAAKDIVSRTVKSQFGSGRKTIKRSVTKRAPPRKTISRGKVSKRGRSDFFSKIKNGY